MGDDKINDGVTYNKDKKTYCWIKFINVNTNPVTQGSRKHKFSWTTDFTQEERWQSFAKINHRRDLFETAKKSV